MHLPKFQAYIDETISTMDVFGAGNACDGFCGDKNRQHARGDARPMPGSTGPILTRCGPKPKKKKRGKRKKK